MVCTLSTPGGAYECTAQCIAGEMTAVTLTAPENVKGLVFRQNDEGIVISRGKLICRSSSITPGQGSVPSCVFSVIESLRGENFTADRSEDGFTYSGSTSCANYTAYADDSGRIENIIITII